MAREGERSVSSGSSTGAPRAHLRRDLQGVRGLGIILVVVGHLWRWPPGVFAMLDMFFVLSGFLITGILVQAFSRYGGRFFVVFYLSRFRRLMPAAVTVILVTVGLFYLLFSSARGELAAKDGVWALLLAVNWHFALTGTDYFSNQDSPLLHYWSLSVEEQFYAVWPLLIFLALGLARRRSRSPETVLLTGLTVITLGAFSYSMWHSVASPTAAYFSTFDRTWEFGIGGLIAVLSPRLARLPLWVGILLGWGGTIGLVVTIFLIPYGVPFPAPYGLFPVLLTAAIMAGGIDRDTSYIPILDNRVMVYLGDLSYSIYLWHLPINLLLLPAFPAGDFRYYVAAVGLTLAASVTCYYLIERPLRYAPWLMTSPERKRLRRRGREPVSARKLRAGWVVLGILATTALSVGSLVTSPPASTGLAPHALRAFQTPKLNLDPWQRQLLAALERTSFPAFDPPLRDLTMAQWGRDQGCVSVQAPTLDDCRFGAPHAGKLAVVVGDSYAVAWMQAIIGALTPRGWAVQQLTSVGCPSWTLPSYVTSEGKPAPECAVQHDLVRQYVEEEHPDLVILASAPAEVLNAGRKSLPGDGVAVARTGLATTLRDLATPAAVVLAPPPPHAILLTCVTRFTGPEQCVSHPDQMWREHVEGESEAAAKAGATYVQTKDWFCLGNDCPGFVGRTPVTVDGSHLTARFSRELAAPLWQALRPHLAH